MFIFNTFATFQSHFRVTKILEPFYLNQHPHKIPLIYTMQLWSVDFTGISIRIERKLNKRTREKRQKTPSICYAIKFRTFYKQFNSASKCIVLNGRHSNKLHIKCPNVNAIDVMIISFEREGNSSRRKVDQCPKKKGNNYRFIDNNKWFLICILIRSEGQHRDLRSAMTLQ